MHSETAIATAEPDELIQLKQNYLLPCVYHFYKKPPHIVAGGGCYLIDHLGRRYLDCYSGVTVMSAGHCNPEIIEPAIEQIRTLQHTTSIYLTEPVLRLAEALAQIAPKPLKRSFFCASGSEAVEGALLLASLHTDRREIVALSGGLHGRTKAAMSATGLAMWRTDPFPLDTVHHVPFGDAAALSCLMDECGNRIAAIIGEPVQGNGGIVVPPADYWPSVRAIATRHRALLVLDEIQTGFNRTGKWFASEHWNIAPDVMAISKAMGNGFPIAAFMTSDEIAASYTRPGASTYGGNPVSAAAALATIEFHRRHELGDCAESAGRRIRQILRDLAADRPHLQNVRGLGLMIGIDVVDAASGPDGARCDAILESMKDHGVLAGKTGPNRNTLTLMPPLTIGDDQIGELSHVLYETL